MIPMSGYKRLIIKLTFCLILLSASALSAATVTLSWDPPATNTDGTPLTDLAGFRIYYGSTSGNYDNSKDAGNVTTYQITDLTPGYTYYFSAKAYDTSGNESEFSNEVVEQIATLSASEIAVTDSVAPSSDLQIPFGNVIEGNSSNQTITVSNSGNANLVIGNIAIANGLAAPFSIESNNCSGQSVVLSNSCAITVRFSPTTVGTFSDTFDIPSNDSDENPVTVIVSGTGLLNNPPAANAGGPYAAVEGQAITLNASASSDSDGSIVLYEWDINSDGTYDYSSSTSTRTHTYTLQGAYTVTLRVRDNLGKTKTATATATITDTLPTSDFAAEVISGTAPLTVSFTNSSTGYDQPLTYEWDFDNNGITDSTGQTPSYTFTSPGTYTVKLTVTDSDGSTKALTRTNYISVMPPTYQLVINLTNNGTVISTPSGIQCPGDCTEQYSSGTVITLTATPQSGEMFGSWTGCTNANGNQCTLTLNANTSVTAIFIANEQNQQNLSCTDGGNIECLVRADGGSDSDNLVSNKPKIDLEYGFRVILKDEAGQTPQYIKLYMTQRSNPQAGEFYSYDMSCSGDYRTGGVCTYVTKLGPAAVHTFYFEAMMSDGTILRYPTAGYISGPEIRMLPGYNLVGIPRDSGNGSLNSATAFGGSAAYRWDADSERYVKLSATESVTEGTGYYVSRQNNTLPELKEFGEIADIQFTYRLKVGWNIISNPYSGNVALADILVRKGNNVPVTWTEATTNGWLTNAIYYNTGKDWGNAYITESAPNATVVPWLGYWIYVDRSDDIYYLVIQNPGM